jgi:hypothetical protein
MWPLSNRSELLTGFVGVLGWALVTVALAKVLRPDVVYLASAGAFCFSLFGWRLLYTIARDGLYKLSR